MLIDYDKQKDLEAAAGASPASVPAASTSAPAPSPPSFDSIEPVAYVTTGTEGYEEPPPEFTPYVAQCFVVGDGDVVSHDPHLNSDGEALYRFLLSQSSTPPVLRIRCQGTHSEFRPRSRSSSFNRIDINSPALSFDSRHSSYSHHHHHHHLNMGQNRHPHRHHGHMETVTDFDFTLDLTSLILPTPALFSTPDSEPAFRGTVTRTYGSGSHMGTLGWKQTRKWKKTRRERQGLGMAPWIATADTIAFSSSVTKAAQSHTSEGLMSNRSLRDWADEYCASSVHLKEFIFTKHVYNWNVTSIQAALESHIAKSYDTRLVQSGAIIVSVETSADKVYIRPDNGLSRALSNKWIKFFLVITLIYPFIWVYMRFGGGAATWDVCGAAYAMKKYLPLDGTEELSDEGQGQGRPSSSSHGSDGESSSTPTREPPLRIVRTPQGPRKVLGTREGEWFKEWESTITDLVNRRYVSRIPLQGLNPVTTRRGTMEAEMLDGYRDT
jgi:hypothetical protein